MIHHADNTNMITTLFITTFAPVVSQTNHDRSNAAAFMKNALKFKVGGTVEARYGGKKKWFVATIVKIYQPFSKKGNQGQNSDSNIPELNQSSRNQLPYIQ